MKNDPLFKFVAAIVVAGVLIALVGPSRTSQNAVATVAASQFSATPIVDGAQ